MESTAEHDADIDEFSDGITTQDDGGESTEPEHPERTMYFGQVEEKPRSVGGPEPVTLWEERVAAPLSKEARF